MKQLIKADFRRVLRDKLLLVMGILAVVFSLFTSLIYGIFLSDLSVTGVPMVDGLVSGKGQFFASFQMGNNLGLIAPVLLAIVLCKDFSYGTVRNKIIAGKRRSAIFASLFVVCATVFIAVMLLHACLNLGLSLIFFGYQSTPFTWADLGYFLVSLLFELLVLLFVSALVSYLCATKKNVGLVIVLYVAVAFALVLVGTLMQMIVSILEVTGGNEQVIDILRFIDRINVGSAYAYIGTGTAYSLTDVLYLTVPPIAAIVGLLGLGLWKFKRRDLK